MSLGDNDATEHQAPRLKVTYGGDVVGDDDDGWHLLDSTEAAKYLGVSQWTLNDYARKGLLGHVPLPGGTRRYRLDQLRAFVEARTIGPDA